MDWLDPLTELAGSTLRDLLPIVAIIVGFQVLVLRRPLVNLPRLSAGFLYLIVGFTLFLLGLEKALFPVGRLMATQLTDPGFLATHDLYPVYLFAFLIGFSTTIAEPALLAVAIKANQVSGGTIGVWGLRVAVALGVAFGITLGVFRIIEGHPLVYYIIGGYIVVVLQTAVSPRMIIPLAYDSGGVTTSTVTVPLVTALGLGLAESIPGRNPVIDGFGLIAFASLFPIIAVLGYAQLAALRSNKPATSLRGDGEDSGSDSTSTIVPQIKEG